MSKPIEFGVVLTDADIRKIDKASHEFGVNRRVGLAVLTRTKEQLQESFAEDTEENSEVFGATLDGIEAYRDRLKMEMEMMDTAWARLVGAVGEKYGIDFSDVGMES